MTKELFVSSTPHETKVGLVEDDQLAEIYLERENEYTLPDPSTKAGSPGFCPECSPHSWTLAWSATPSCTSPISWNWKTAMKWKKFPPTVR